VTSIGQGRRLLLVCGLALTCLSWPGQAHAAPEHAKSADAVVESAGVNVHTYFSGVYENYDAWKPKLVALGVRYIRDGLAAGLPFQHALLNDLADSGIRANLVMGDPKNKYGTGTLDQLVSVLKTEIRSAVVSVEGPNEWDDVAGDSYPCDPVRPELGCWATDLRAYQQELYAKIKADSALAGLAVVGPIVVGDRQLVGDLSPWLDYGNMHPYPGNRNPEWSLNPSGGDEFDLAANNSGDKPVMATETGYHNALQYPDAGHRPVSERAAGIYVPRLLLDYFGQASSRGQTVKRSFLYELIDETDDHRFGLLRNDLSEKPAYKSLKNLLALLEDRGPAFDPGSLDYSLDGATTELRRLLLQKRDGSFWLALWRDVDVWDESSGGDLYPGEQHVTLRLARPVARAAAYRPGVSATPYESWRDTSALQLRVPADVVLVRLGGPPGSWSDPPARRPTSQRPGARRFLLDFGKSRRASRISIRWPAGRGHRYRISTSVGQRKFRRAGLVRLRKNGRDVVRFRPRRVRFVRLVQVDRRPAAVGTISRRHVRLGGRRR
jgi:hypothetical protein